MLILGNFDTQSWTADNDTQAYSSEIKIGFRNGEENPVVFDNLSFGFAVLDGETELLSGSYPPVNVTYKSSDQEYLVADVVNDLVPEETYTVSVWANNAGQRFEDVVSFTTPRPPQPFESWIYDSENKYWVAPVPAPEDGNDYMWNEETQTWDLFVRES